MGRRVLIIDDDDSLREVLSHSLARDGLQVEGAIDGKEGLSKIESFKPHLIILDLMMPGIDGFGVLKHLRDSGRADIPVIVVSGKYTEDSVESTVLSTPPVVEFMRKPVRYADLGDMIKRFLAPAA